MAKNNRVELIGNIGAKAKVIQNSGTPFVAFNLATKDSYKDKAGNWQDKATVWHNIISFAPKLIDIAQQIKTSDRIKVSGYLSYRFFEVANKTSDSLVKKKEASIIAEKIEIVPFANDKTHS